MRLLIDAQQALGIIAMSAIVSCGGDQARRAPATAGLPQILVELVAELGEDEYPGAIGSPIARASRLRNGRYLVASGPDRGEIAVFDEDGRFLGRLGRFGEGPGEFRAPAYHWLSPTLDTLVVVDPQSARITMMSPDARETFQTSPLPLYNVLGLTFMSNGSMIVNAPRYSEEGIGLPLHLVSRDGVLIRSFGSREPSMASDNALSLLTRIVAPSGADRIWVAHARDPIIEEWNLDGELLRSSTLKLDWFPPEASRRGFPRTPSDDPPSLAIRAIWEDDNGRLWIVTAVPTQDWRGHFRLSRDPGARRPYELVGFDEELYDSRIQVWATKDWSLVADTVVPNMWFGAFGGGYGYSRHLDGPGVPRMRVWHARLEGLLPR